MPSNMKKLKPIISNHLFSLTLYKVGGAMPEELVSLIYRKQKTDIVITVMRIMMSPILSQILNFSIFDTMVQGSMIIMKQAATTHLTLSSGLATKSPGLFE